MASRDFMDRVQQHEREWGMKQYKNRPSLGDILQAEVVIFWDIRDQNQPDVITLHNNLESVERHLLRMLLTSNNTDNPKKRIADIYQNHKRMMIKAVKVVFAEAND